MLKRIAIVGKDDALFQTVKTAAEQRDMQVFHLRPGDALPVATAAVVAAAEDGPDVLDAAEMLGVRHDELYDLLAQALDAREGFLPGSSQRVREYAARFAEALGLSLGQQLTLERATLLRDIGKTKVPNEVLLKKDVLTYNEWQLLQQHAHMGRDLVLQIEGLKDTADAIRCHHECYDGGGYPEKLEKNQIPHLARIVKLLDVYCAMTSPRHYRSGQSSPEDAIAHIKEESGKAFDPQLVQIFVDHHISRPTESDV